VRGIDILKRRDIRTSLKTEGRSWKGRRVEKVKESLYRSLRFRKVEEFKGGKFVSLKNWPP